MEEARSMPSLVAESELRNIGWDQSNRFGLFLVGGSGVWTQILTWSTTRAHHPPALVLLVIFQVETRGFAQASCTICVAGVTDVHHHAKILIEMGILLTFCQGWS